MTYLTEGLAVLGVLSCLAMAVYNCGSVSPSTVRIAPAYSAGRLNGFVRVAQYRPVFDRQTRQPMTGGPEGDVLLWAIG